VFQRQLRGERLTEVLQESNILVFSLHVSIPGKQRNNRAAFVATVYLGQTRRSENRAQIRPVVTEILLYPYAPDLLLI
jgi:hypothetical protein